jgi:tight adherence protein B
VPAALRSAATLPGAEALASVAACWQVAQRNGAGLATALRRLTESLRAEEALRREIASQLAGARATARLLAALPALGLLLGSGLGGRPLDVLLHTPYGLACLVGGVTMQVTGVWWTDQIAAAAERRA